MTFDWKQQGVRESCEIHHKGHRIFCHIQRRVPVVKVFFEGKLLSEDRYPFQNMKCDTQIVAKLFCQSVVKKKIDELDKL